MVDEAIVEAEGGTSLSLLMELMKTRRKLMMTRRRTHIDRMLRRGAEMTMLLAGAQR